MKGNLVTKETKNHLMWTESTHGFLITRARRTGGDKWGKVVLKVRYRSHLSHGEIVLVTNDDHMLGYKD